MESKTKHRILGVLVVAGLAVIAYPFLQSREGSSDVVAVKEPAFPDQSVQLTPPVQEAVQQPVAEMENSTTPSSAATNVTTAPEAATTASTTTTTTTPSAPAATTATPDSETSLGSEVVKSEPDDIIKNEHPAEPSKSAPAIASPGEEQNATTTEDEAPKKTSSVKKSKSTTLSKKAKHSPYQLSSKTSKKTLANKTVKNNHLFNIQDPSWVIQVGSFKNKTAALKVVNQLRASGYRAFIQQFASGDDSTRVFVGPENKQVHARQLAQDLNAKMHLQGIVISYQPLA